jgi:hypothetical protein
MGPRSEAATIVLHTNGESVSIPLADVLGDDDLRIFTIIGEADVSFAAARMGGEVIVPRVTRIEIR